MYCTYFENWFLPYVYIAKKYTSDYFVDIALYYLANPGVQFCTATYTHSYDTKCTVQFWIYQLLIILIMMLFHSRRFDFLRCGTCFCVMTTTHLLEIRGVCIDPCFYFGQGWWFLNHISFFVYVRVQHDGFLVAINIFDTGHTHNPTHSQSDVVEPLVYQFCSIVHDICREFMLVFQSVWLFGVLAARGFSTSPVCMTPLLVGIACVRA